MKLTASSCQPLPKRLIHAVDVAESGLFNFFVVSSLQNRDDAHCDSQDQPPQKRWIHRVDFSCQKLDLYQHSDGHVRMAYDLQIADRQYSEGRAFSVGTQHSAVDGRVWRQSLEVQRTMKAHLRVDAWFMESVSHVVRSPIVSLEARVASNGHTCCVPIGAATLPLFMLSQHYLKAVL